MTIKVAHLSFSDIEGGAARAAYRLHRALLDVGADSRVWALRCAADDWTVEGPRSLGERLVAEGRILTGHAAAALFRRKGQPLPSLAALPSGIPDRAVRAGADVLHLHWIGGETASVAEIGRITAPTIWTLHDMWAFSGAQHYPTDQRWRSGYTRASRPGSPHGLDVDRWVWARKRRWWRRPIHLVAPSRWMAECAAASPLLGHWPRHVIPNAIDTDCWSPVDRARARELLRLPNGVPLMLFGASGGGNDPRKGFALLQEALARLHASGKCPDLQIAVFGQAQPRQAPNLHHPVHWLGRLRDDVALRLCYAAADAFALTSLQDNLPNTGVEALACGTPVVAFDVGGLADIVDHRQNGYLAKAFDTTDLASGFEWVLDPARRLMLSASARAKAMSAFSAPLIAQRHLALYQQVMDGASSAR